MNAITPDVAPHAWDRVEERCGGRARADTRGRPARCQTGLSAPFLWRRPAESTLRLWLHGPTTGIRVRAEASQQDQEEVCRPDLAEGLRLGQAADCPADQGVECLPDLAEGCPPDQGEAFQQVLVAVSRLALAAGFPRAPEVVCQVAPAADSTLGRVPIHTGAIFLRSPFS
jgi:hypothetical protein